MKTSKIHDGRIRLVVLLGLMFVLNLFLFYWPGFPVSLGAITGDLPVTRVPDVRILFSPAETYDFFTAIGPDGRESFRLMHLTVDLSFPFIYSLFFFLLIQFLLNRLNHTNKILPFIPLLAGTTDLAENFLLNFLAGSYPVEFPSLAILVELITIFKFLLIATSFVFSIYLALRWVIGSSAKH